jgi:hypothetical protein
MKKHPDNPKRIPWLTVMMHGFAKTKPRPANHDGDWKDTWSAVCRYDKIFNGMYKDCYICDHIPNDKGKKSRPSPKVWALAAMREEVFDKESGTLLGIRTQMKEVAETDKDGKPTDKKLTVPNIVVVNMAYSNFFGPVAGTCNRKGTVLANDIEITRLGIKMDDTEYRPEALDQISLADGRVLDLRDNELMEQYFPGVPDLRRFIVEKSTDRFYKHFFIPGEDDDVATSLDAVPAPSADADPERVAKLRSRVFQQSKESGDEGDSEKASAPAGGGLVAYE